MAGELDRDKLLAFLRERREARGVNDSSGLVLSSLYEGLETRIKAGQFDPDAPADQLIERRITYRYGVNRDQTRTGFLSYESLHEDVVHDTMGPVNVTKREHRTVTRGTWVEEPSSTDQKTGRKETP